MLRLVMVALATWVRRIRVRREGKKERSRRKRSVREGCGDARSAAPRHTSSSCEIQTVEARKRARDPVVEMHEVPVVDVTLRLRAGACGLAICRGSRRSWRTCCEGRGVARTLWALAMRLVLEPRSETARIETTP